MSKIPIFVDFDGTLFDTSAFRERIYDVFIKSGYSLEDIKSTYVIESMDYKYDPQGHLAKLQKIKHTNIKLADARIDNLYADVPKYLYPDSLPFIESLDTNKFQLNILTLGDINFQKRKVDAADISNYFENIYVTDIQKWDYFDQIIKDDQSFVLIDDRADTLEKVRAKYPKSLCLQIVRQDLDIDDAALFYKDVYSGIKIKDLRQALRYLE